MSVRRRVYSDMEAREAVTDASPLENGGDQIAEPQGRSSGRHRVDAGAVAATIVPLVLILYLGLSNGGYGVEARSYAGLLAWIAVAVACIASVRPREGISRSAAVAFVLLGLFAAWTALSFSWTENDERTAVEVGRVLVYLGVFTLAIALQARGHVRQVIAGTTAGVTLLCAVALLSRVEPNLFPERVSGRFLDPSLESRLAYPLNYSGGIATLATMTLPLLLAQAWAARTLAIRVIAAAAIPMVLVTLWLTGSGLILAISWVGVAAFLVLTELRLRHLATLLVGVAGGTVLSFAVVQLEAVDRGLTTPQALEEGDRLLVLTLVVMVVVGAAHLGLNSLVTRFIPPGWKLPASARRLAAAAAVVGVLAVGLALVTSGAVDSGFDRFQSREGLSVDASRVDKISDLSSSGRYQQWRSALDAFESEPMSGIGAGTFEFWWARNGLYSGFVRDAHSLYLETLAELGIVGLTALLAFITAVVYVAVRRTVKAVGSERRLRAGAVGMLMTFVAGAGVDWMWELGVLPVAFMLVAAGACMPWTAPASAEQRPDARDGGLKAATAVAAVAATAMIAVPALMERRIEQSQEEFRNGDLDAAYQSALSAEDIAPYAASPHLQRAFVLERAGRLKAAVAAAEQAVDRAPTDWRPALILSQLQDAAGATKSAQKSFEQARSLNPYSKLFKSSPDEPPTDG